MRDSRICAVRPPPPRQRPRWGSGFKARRQGCPEVHRRWGVAALLPL